jgi:cyanophycinase
VSGAVLHVLPAGSQFDLATRALLAHKTALADPEAIAAGAEEADLQEVARDIM